MSTDLGIEEILLVQIQKHMHNDAPMMRPS